MKQILPLALTLAALAGCVSAGDEDDKQSVAVNVDNSREQRINEQDAFQTAEPAMYMRQQPLVTVNEYARNLVHELMALHQAVEDDAYIGVTDLAYVDTDLLQGSILSNHLSEAIIYDLHKFGAKVVDFKVTDYVRVTENGDFALSRDFTELTASQPIKYVVTGTLTKHKLGVLVNARLVQINNKRVISAARSFIPANVVQAVLQHEAPQQLMLKQG